MKLALVVQRYGRDVAGGSEAHCREIAERLAERHDVTVLTSCARDYITWKNEFPAGESVESGVRVLRFRARRRRMQRFLEISEYVFSGEGDRADQESWFRESGPRVPTLLQHLEQHGSNYDRVLFWTFRYFPSFFGLPLVEDRAVLLPTAEEDPAIEIAHLGEFFERPRGLLFLTPEEAVLVGRRVSGELPPFDVIGSGLDPVPLDDGADDRSTLSELGIERPFALYLGRVDPNKGCETMLRYYQRYAETDREPIDLVLAGRAVMQVPAHEQIHALGFVSEEAREALLRRARFLIMPSPFESLSLVLLEAWNHQRPALVNGCCKVLKGQVRRANGGLYYNNFFEFAEGFRFLGQEKETGDRLGEQGLEYIEANYRWPVVIGKIERFLERT